MQHLINSFIGFSIGELVTLPLSALKTNFVNGDPARMRTYRDAAREIMTKRGGVLGFYRGNYFALSGQIVRMATTYTMYQYLKQFNPFGSGYVANCANAVVSGITIALCSQVFDKMRIRRQTGCDRKTTSFTLKYLFKGYSATLSRQIAGSITYLPLQDLFRQHMSNTYAFICAAACGAALTQPFDYIKTRVLNDQPVQLKYASRGFAVGIVRAIVHFTISMSCVQKLNSENGENSKNL